MIISVIQRRTWRCFSYEYGRDEVLWIPSAYSAPFRQLHFCPQFQSQIYNGLESTHYRFSTCLVSVDHHFVLSEKWGPFQMCSLVKKSVCKLLAFGARRASNENMLYFPVLATQSNGRLDFVVTASAKCAAKASICFRATHRQKQNDFRFCR